MTTYQILVYQNINGERKLVFDRSFVNFIAACVNYDRIQKDYEGYGTAVYMRLLEIKELTNYVDGRY